MENSGAQFSIKEQQGKVTIQFTASKKLYASLFNGLMPVIYAGLLAAGMFFSSPNAGGKSPPALPATSCPRIDIPAVGQGESA
jgi:hypothetical protein